MNGLVSGNIPLPDVESHDEVLEKEWGATNVEQRRGHEGCAARVVLPTCKGGWGDVSSVCDHVSGLLSAAIKCVYPLECS